MIDPVMIGAGISMIKLGFLIQLCLDDDNLDVDANDDAADANKCWRIGEGIQKVKARVW